MKVPSEIEIQLGGGEPLEGSGFEVEPIDTDYAVESLDTAERIPQTAPQKP
jgi:hypothetical protein